jgi:hypothetical protein
MTPVIYLITMPRVDELPVRLSDPPPRPRKGDSPRGENRQRCRARPLPGVPQAWC